VQRGLDREPPDDILFVYPWVYRWGLLFEYSICAYWVGELAAALGACERLLAIPELPEAYRAQTRENRAHTLRAIAKREGRLAEGAPSRTSTTAGS
jgi:hypothetical protein